MTRVSKTLAATMGLFLWTGPAIASDEVEAELAEMRRLVEGLQQKVDAQEEQLSAQGRNLEEAQRVVRRTQEETEAVSGLAFLWAPLRVQTAWQIWLGIGLIAFIWASTFLLQVPAHGELASGFNERSWRMLVRSNWLRTLAWSARAGLVTYWLHQTLHAGKAIGV